MTQLLKLLLMLACLLGGAVLIMHNALPLGLVIGAVGLGLFVQQLLAQNKQSKVDSGVIADKYNAFVKALNETHTLAIRKLGTATDAELAPILEKLVAAGSHMGSNPAWRNTQRITTAGDVMRWYDDGKALADEARAMIDKFEPRKGGIEGTLL